MFWSNDLLSNSYIIVSTNTGVNKSNINYHSSTYFPVNSVIHFHFVLAQ
jgi:hypothetical protein